MQRESDATWAISSEDEWYKAAYHKNDGVTGNYFDYPTSSDSVPGRDLNDASGNNANYRGNPYPIDSPYYTTVAGERVLIGAILDLRQDPAAILRRMKKVEG